ncbi:hypothetical protein R3W88_022662 [Solanum pinnatisectum]|uniref:Uncharacterized protein n=1 Tax=Solanum pinnatisectum TaxID=50273 RepID=A0AAV9LXF5_9SOLN|nr:hypothetical protein R3W88_022662 [Solanum pinnatisectum]
MDLMKQNHEMLQSELLQIRQFMQKYAPNESLPQDINGTSNEQVPDHNYGQGVPQSSRISSNAEITLPHGTTDLYHLMLFFEFSLLVFFVFVFNRSVRQLNLQFVVVVVVVVVLLQV